MCCTSYLRTALPVSASSNRRLFSTLAALAVAMLVPLTAIAQAAGTGAIRGKAQNATNGAFLANVVVKIAGTSRQAITTDTGDYEFTNVPAGEVNLVASYVGEPDQKLTVTVMPNTAVNQDLTFRESAATKRDDKGTLMLDPYKVSAERYHNARDIAIAEERNSVNIKNVVSIDQFGIIPSGNVGEFVKFMPGVQVDYGASNGNSQGYAENTANGVSVRGFGPEDTTILVDGLPISATVPGNLTSQVGLDQLSINNASRVELIKVATPDMPANSAGGQINLITKRAYEYAKPSYEAQLFFNFNSQNFTLDRTQGPTNKKTFKTSPGVQFSVSYPFSQNFGMSFSATLQETFSQSYRAQPVWNNTWNNSFNPSSFANLAGEKSSLDNPVLTRYQITDSPTITDQNSANWGVDWKPTANQALHVNFQYSTYETSEAQRRLDFRPTVAAGADWGPDRTVGTTANSTLASTVTTRDRIGNTLSGQLTYKLDWKGWRVNVAGSYSSSKSDFEDEKNGHYSGIDMNLNPGRVAVFYTGGDGIPNHVDAYARTTNAPLDYTQITNWALAGTQATSGQAHNEDVKALYKIDFSRALDFLPFMRSNPLTLQFGYRHDLEHNFKDGRGTGFKEDLAAGKTFSTADIIDENYKNVTPGFGLAPQQWVSTYKLYELNQQNNLFVAPTDGATAVGNYNSELNQNKDIRLTTDAVYGQISGGFFDNRLTFLAGMRQERQDRVGKSPFTDTKWNFVKKADGSLYIDAANPGGVQDDIGNGVLVNGVATTGTTNRPLYFGTPFANNAALTSAQLAQGASIRAALAAAGVPFPSTPYGSVSTDLAARKLQGQMLHPVNQHVTNDPSFSINTVYKLTKKIDLKAAFSRSFKQPPLENGSIGLISGNNLSINEFTTTEQASNNGLLGNIVIGNPAVKAEKSLNWDFEVSYYTDNGGKATVSYYTKDVTGAIQTFSALSGTEAFDQTLTALGLVPSDYDGWRVQTNANSLTKQKTDGWEVMVSQDFGVLGKWGRRFSAFLSYAWTNFPPPSPVVPYAITNPDGTTTTITPTRTLVTLRANHFGGAGLQYSGDRFSLQVRGTYRNEAQDTSQAPIIAADGSIFRAMQPAETRIDVSMSYQINKTYSVYASGRDVFNGHRDRVWENDQHAIASFATLFDRKQFGAAWTVGVKGTW